MMLLGHHFFFIQFEFGLMMMGKCVCSFSNIRTEQKIHAMLKKLLSSALGWLVKQMLWRRLTKQRLLFPWKHFSCQDSIIFWPQQQQIIYHLSYIVNRQIPSGTSETLKRAADEVAKMTAMLQMEVIMSRAGNQDVNTKILDHQSGKDSFVIVER